MQEPVVPFDLMRMFLGDAPSWFLLEILARTAIIYVYTLLLLRWVGGRSVSQLSLIEFLLVIALGSAVGDALFYPEVPLLHAMMAITLVVCADKVLDWLILKFHAAKHLIDGTPIQIIKDGTVCQKEASSFSMGPPELFSRLRIAGITNLGEISYAYIEPGGVLSIFRNDRPRPGLCIVPPHCIDDPVTPVEGEDACCTNCGSCIAGHLALEKPSCTNCLSCDWTRVEIAKR